MAKRAAKKTTRTRARARTKPAAPVENPPVLIEPDGSGGWDATELSAQGLARGADAPIDPLFFATIRFTLQRDKFDAPFEQHPWVYSVVESIAQPLSTVPFRLYRQSSKRERSAEVIARSIRQTFPGVSHEDAQRVAATRRPRDRFRRLRELRPLASPEQYIRAMVDGEIVEAGAWYELFRRPNADCTKAQLWEGSVINRATVGECFWKLNNLRGQPVGPNEIPAAIMVFKGGKEWEPDVDPGGAQILGWTHTFTTKKGRRIRDQREMHQLVYGKRFNPSEQWRGLSPLHAVKLDLEADFAAMLWNLAFFKNGAQPGGILLSEKRVAPKVKKQILEEWEQRHSGERKSHRPDLLEGGIKFIPTQSTQKDMEFQKTRTMTRDIVMGVFRVSKTALGISEDVNRAVASTAKSQHWDEVVVPEGQYWEDLLDASLLTDARGREGGADWGAFDWSTVDALREDLNEVAAAGQKLMEMGATYNEVNTRLELGMEEQPWGDSWYRKTALTVVNEKEETPEPEEPDDEDDSDDDEDGNDDFFSFGAGKPRKQLHAAPGLMIPKDSVRIGGRVVKRDAFWDDMQSALFDPATLALSKRVGAFVFNLRNAQLRQVEEQPLDSTPAELLAFPLGVWQDEIEERTDPDFRKVVRTTIDWTEGGSGELRGVKPYLRDLEEYEFNVTIRKLTRTITRSVRTIRKGVLQLIEEALDKGATKQSLLTSLRKSFNTLRQSGRVGLIANTLGGMAINDTRDQLFLKGGVNEHEWITAADEHVRDRHEIYGASGAIPIGANWAQFTGGSYMLRRPHDPSAPAGEIIHCRCAAVPIL